MGDPATSPDLDSGMMTPACDTAFGSSGSGSSSSVGSRLSCGVQRLLHCRFLLGSGGGRFEGSSFISFNAGGGFPEVHNLGCRFTFRRVSLLVRRHYEDLRLGIGN